MSEAGVHDVASVPSPIGGLNARDSIVAMPETDALIMHNWWPQPYGCTVRKGTLEWATGLGGEVSSLATWASTTGVQKLFAWSGANVYDVTAQGAVGAPLITGITNAIWEYVNLVNAAGSHLIALNGFDDGIIYAAAGGDRITFGDGIVPQTWAGIDPKNAVNPIVHQHRLWVVEKDSANGWFLPPDAVQGTFLKFDFGPLFSRGGFLQFLATWTIDDGNGAEDHLLAMSSRGEVAVYSGTDPEDDTKWALVGVYFIGAPVAGRRAHCKAGGDHYILTQQGLVSMASLLLSTKVENRESIFKSAKIQFLLSELTASFGTLYGWDLKYFARDNLLILNVPTVVTGGNIQLASNQITEAWTEFRQIDASCWDNYSSLPMFGDYSGRVMMAWTGNKDNVRLDGSGGDAIITSVQQAYSYLGKRVNQKQVGLYRPVFVTSSRISIRSAILYDFVTDELTAPTPIPSAEGSIWGVGIWGTSIWGGGSTVQRSWIQAEGMGVAVSYKMTLQTATETLWVSTDYSYIIGRGIL